MNRIYAAHITVVEVVAALSRRARTGTLTAADVAKAIGRFRRSFDRRLLKIAISGRVIARAVSLAEQHGLRGYDAVQLAAAMEIHQERVRAGASPIVLVSADEDLNAAVLAAGLLVENPHAHP